MKPLLSLLVLLFSSIAATAQMQLEDFYKKGSSWCEIEARPMYKMPYFVRPHTYTIVDDSIVNSQKYHLVNYSAHDNYNYNPVYDDMLIGGIRISSDSVYFIRLNSFNWPVTGQSLMEKMFDLMLPLEEEVLLYHYNLKLGDTVPKYRSEDRIVVEIDSVNMSNGYALSRYKLRGDSLKGDLKDNWIWGIGSSSSFFGPFTSHLYGITIFYSNPDFEYLFSNALDIAGCFPLSVESTNKIKNELLVYPNPLIDNILHITSPGIEKLSVIDMTGKVVYAKLYIPNGDQTINLELLPGVYLLKTQLMNGTQEVHKLIKQ